MNEATTTTMSDWSKDEQEFTEVIIDVVKNRHAKHEQKYQEGKYEPVLLENIHFGIVRTGIGDLESSTGIPRLQEIAKIQGRCGEDWPITAQRMLDLFCCKGEIIERCVENKKVYKLSKDGLLYEYLAGH